MSLSLHPLSLGEIELDHSFTVWQTKIGESVWSPTTGWLILDSDNPIVVDTSFCSVEDARSFQHRNCRRTADQSFEAQLPKHGLKAADIAHIIHTHVHMDHAGQDNLFPNARIYVQRRELQMLRRPICTRRLSTAG